MKYRIALLKGDGIGPEIIDEAIKCLDVVAAKFGHEFEYDEQIIGGEAIDAVGCGPHGCSWRTEMGHA